MKKTWILFLFMVFVFDVLQAQVKNKFQIGIYGVERETCMHEYSNGCEVPVLNTDTLRGNHVCYTSAFNVLAQDGFNTVHTYNPIYNTTERWLQRFIQLCGNNGLKMVISLNGAYYQPDPDSDDTGTNTYNSLGHYFGPCDSPKDLSQSRPNIDQLMNKVFTVSPYKDIISGYYIADEPSTPFAHQYLSSIPNGNITDTNSGAVKKVEVPPFNVRQAMDYVKMKLANKNIFDKDVIICNGNHWRSIHDNINDGMGCCYNPQDYVKLLKCTDKRDVFWDDAYQTNALLYHQSRYEDIRNNGPEDNMHYLGVYKGLEYEQQYTQTTHKVISIYIDDSETGFPREANLHVDTAIPNANLLSFQTYTSIIHGAKGIWFWGLLWSATPDEQQYWQSNSVERFNRDHFPEIYRKYVSPLARELRFLVEKNVLSTDPRTIIATKTDRKDPLGIIPPIFSYDSISWSAYLSVPRRRIERFREYYGLRYTIRTNGEETYMIITNPLNCPVKVTLDFNTIPSGNPFLTYLDHMELMFEDSLPSLTDVASSTYKKKQWIVV